MKVYRIHFILGVIIPIEALLCARYWSDGLSCNSTLDPENNPKTYMLLLSLLIFEEVKAQGDEAASPRHITNMW